MQGMFGLGVFAAVEWVAFPRNRTLTLGEVGCPNWFDRYGVAPGKRRQTADSRGFAGVSNLKQVRMSICGILLFGNPVQLGAAGSAVAADFGQGRRLPS